MGYTLAAIDIGQSLQRMLDNVIRIVPKLLVFVVILIIGWIIAKVIERAVTMILHRVHFDRVAERGVVGDALRRSDYDASRLIARLFCYAILLITLFASRHILPNADELDECVHVVAASSPSPLR